MKRTSPARVQFVRLTKDSLSRIGALSQDPRFRLRLEVGLAIGLGVGLLLSVSLFLNIFGPADRWFTDLVYQPIQPSGHVAIVSIDQKSLDQIGPYPWPRSTYVRLVDFLSTAKARVIVIDVLFPEPSTDDGSLAVAMRRAGNVILATAGGEEGKPNLRSGFLPEYDEFSLPAADLGAVANAIGHRNLSADSDGVLRRMSVAIETPSEHIPSLGIAAAQAFLSTAPIKYNLPLRQVSAGGSSIQTDEYGRMLLNFTDSREQRNTYSFSDVVDGHVPPTVFREKVVFIGGTPQTDLSAYATPFSASKTAANVTVEAGAAEMLLSDPPQLLRSEEPLNQIAITLFVGLVAGLTLPHIRPLSAAALTILYLLALIIVAFQVFARGLILHVFYPGAALAATFLLVAAFRYLSEERRRQFLTVLFRRYVPAESVAHVVDAVDRGELPLSGTRRQVTVLYADLRGFSTLSEGLAPEAVLELVSSYLEIMLREIQSENGTVNKPMGDALVAIWNAPLDQPDHAERGLRAAIAIRRSIELFQDTRGEEKSLNIGLGLSTGKAVVGNISALGKVEYTLVGDTVSVASRISAFAGNYQILADSGTAQAAPEEMDKRELTPIRIRGRKEPLPVWEIKHSPQEIGEEERSFED
jgi:adenylate cyclase